MAVDVNAGARRVEVLLSRPRAKLIVLGCVLVWFLAWRWLQRLQPWDSDDVTLFQISAGAASGNHWLLGAVPQGLDSPTPLSHQALRVGLLPVSVPAILAFGASSQAYYVVPLLFALVGFWCVGWVALEHFGLLVALVTAVIHAVWPFELAHGSAFLVDLPSAAMALSSLCLLEAGRQHQRARGRLSFAVLAGLAVLESYFLRSNVLVLIAPAYLVFICRRDCRGLVGVALAVLGLGLLAEQGLFVWRGLGFGYGWSRVNLALEQYSEFLPVYSWWEFAIRQLRHQFTSFGHGITGALASLLLLGSLLGHVLAFRFERRPLLLAIMIFGAFTWLVFSFSIYERVGGGVRAMAPISNRYIQPFTYSSVLVWAWLWSFIRERGWRRAADGARAGWLGAALVALPLVLLGFSLDASLEHLPGLYRQSASNRLFAALRDRAARTRAPVDVAGLPRGLRVAHILCCGDDGPVRWRDLPATELAEAIQREHVPFVLRNTPRELSDARYMDPVAQELYRAALERVDDALWRDYALVHLDETYALFERRPSAREHDITPGPPPPIEDLSRLSMREEAACFVTHTNEGARLALERVGPHRASCQYPSPQDGIVVSEPELSRSSDYVLRVSVDHQPTLSVTVEVVQYDGREIHRRSQRVFPGTSYVPVVMRPETRAAYVVYRVNGSATSGASVAIRPAQWGLLSPAQS